MSDESDIVINEAPMIFGGYIENAAMSVGYGADSGSCQLTVVFEDDGPLRTSNKDSNFPNVGTACAFKFGECTFGGIYQRYTHKKSLDGYRYDVILESPGKWMEGIQIILDNFQGTRYTAFGAADTITNQLDNVWNPFAIRENFEYGGIYGGSNVNSAGFPALDALYLIQEISQGLHAFGGPAHFGDSYYEVDLSEVIAITPSYFRLAGQVQSLASVIQECCEIALHDYVVFIDSKSGIIEKSGVIDDPIIKIKVINKSFQPNPDFIKTTVEKYEREQKLISADHGKEFPDIVTQRLVIGGAASRISVSGGSPPYVYPIWGKKAVGVGVDRYLLGDGLEMNSSVPLYIKSTNSQYVTDVLEVRCAMSGFNTWVLYHLLKNQAFPFFTNIAITDYHIDGLINGTLTVNSLLNTTSAVADYYTKVFTGENFMEFINKIYDEVRQAGEESYGKKFLVRLPAEPGGPTNNLKFTAEDYQYISSWVISSSGWSNTKPFSDLAFYDGDGKLKHYAVWNADDRYDYSQFGSEYATGNGGIGTYKITVDQDIYWYNGAPWAVVEVPAVSGYDDITTQQYGLFHLVKWFKGQTPDIRIMSSFGSESGPLSYEIKPRRIGPSKIGIAQESNRYTWGPWWWVSDKRGKAEVRVEDTLKPETFGSIGALDEVGFSYANTAGATINSVESGYIELAEIPQFSLAEKFAGSGPYVTNISINIALDGIKTTYKFNTWTPQFGKLAKYNADRISRINKNYIRFMQDKRSRWTKPPMPSVDPKNGSVQGSPNMISPVWNNPAMHMILGQLVDVDGKNIPNIVGGHPVNAMSGFGENKSVSYGSSMEQIHTPATIENSGDRATKTQPLPTKSDLNPYFPPVKGEESIYGVSEDKAKNDFQLAFSDLEVNELDINKEDNFAKIKEIKTMAPLRSPLLLSGWGYGLDDAPTPGSNREFDEDAMTDRSLWKSGPVHLMWDEEREVWAGGPHFLEGVLDSHITKPDSIDEPTEFTVKIYRKPYEGSWEHHEEIITCYNRDMSLEVINKEDKIYILLIRINYEWRPLWISCPDNI